MNENLYDCIQTASKPIFCWKKLKLHNLDSLKCNPGHCVQVKANKHILDFLEVCCCLLTVRMCVHDLIVSPFLAASSDKAIALELKSLTMLSMAVWCFRKNGRITWR